MAYIRIKKINNAPYAYLVESTSTSSGPRQKVKKYLGRVHALEKKEERLSVVQGKNKKTFFASLLGSTLRSHGLREEQGRYVSPEFTISSISGIITKKGTSKDVVLSLNEGYLCQFTIQRILQFTKTKNVNDDAPVLAKYFLEAGVAITPEEFVKFYELL
ncbi:MAG: hypothetical protein AABX37_06310 [Nanoarchaeota archaeon]